MRRGNTGGKSAYTIMNRNSLAKFIKVKNKLCLCNIWRIMISIVETFIFRQQHMSKKT